MRFATCSIPLKVVTSDRRIARRSTNVLYYNTQTQSYAEITPAINNGAVTKTASCVRISNYFDLSSSAQSGTSNNLECTYKQTDEVKVSTLAWYYYDQSTNT